MRQAVLRTKAALAVLLAGMAALLWSTVSFAAPPTLGADCGAAASIVGTDSAGKVTLGNGVSTCTLTFSLVPENAPACTAMNETKARPVDATTTRTTLRLGFTVSLDPGDVISYICVGY